VYRRNSQQRNGLNAGDSRLYTTLVGLRQNYRSRNNLTTGAISYNRAISEDARIGQDKKDYLSFSIDHRPFKFHTLRLEANTTRDVRPALNNYRALNDTVLTSYTWQPDSTFSAVGIFNLYKSNYRTGTNPNTEEHGSLSKQLSGTGSWRPQDSSLTLNASARLYRLSNSDQNSSNAAFQRNSQNTLGLNATYILAKGIRATGTVMVTDGAGKQTVATSESLTATKSFQEITRMGSFTYRRYISGNLSNQNSTTTGAATPAASTNTQTLTLSAGHSITNNTPFYDSILISNVNQILTSGVRTSSLSTAPTSSLATNGSLAWAHKEPEMRSTTSIRLTASDNRSVTSSGLAPRQVINGQIQRTDILARNQSLSGNLTLQAFRSGATATVQGMRSTNANGILSYRYVQAFHIPNLIFLSTLRLDNTYLASRETESTKSWENNLSYTLGKLSLKLDSRFSKLNKQNMNSVVFVMRRYF
jgi:hypothetical protein